MSRSVKQVQRVLVTAGGTGGHVFPALAAAKLFQQKGIDVKWVGTHQGIESKIVPANNIDIEYINVAGVRGQGLVRLLWAPLRISKAILDVMAISRSFKPDLVLGMGGFVTGPTGAAVWLSGRSVFVHEQNAVAGFTNKLLARIAKRVFQAFPGAFPAGSKVETTGNPVRKEIIEMPLPGERYGSREGDIRILILGGSQGAVALNETVPQALALLKEKLAFSVRHQAGEKNLATAASCYEAAGVDVQVDAFIDDMAEAYEWADLVVCRSGALTVSELAAAGVASLLVPYPFAVDDHQTKNAEYLSGAGAAVLVQQNQLTPDKLAHIIMSELSSRQVLATMAEKARNLAMVNATEKLVERCLELAYGN